MASIDARLDAVARTVRASNFVPDTIDFHDIAGLVKGASQGEGLGNKFLAHIREVDAVEGIRRVRFTSPHPHDFTPDVIAAMEEAGIRVAASPSELGTTLSALLKG